MRRILILILPLLIIWVADGYGDLSDEVPASEVLSKIKAGEPVEYDYVIINGDLSLNQSAIPEENDVRAHFFPENMTPIYSLIRINNSVINGTVNLNGILFQKPVDFNNIRFNSDVHFNRSVFNSTAYFVGSEFNSDAYFIGSQFRGVANFMNSKFNSDAYFNSSAFYSDAYFISSVFNSVAYFTRSRFSSAAIFWEPLFQRAAYFRGSLFDSRASFSGSKFNSDVYFLESRFKEDADFNGSEFNSTTYFWKSKFCSDAHFWGSRFDGDVHFEESLFNNAADFTGSQFNKIADYSRSTFKEELGLKNIYFDKINLDWDQISGIRRNFDGKVYLSLIESHKAHGFYSDADNLYYVFRKEQFLQRHWIEDPLMYIFDLCAWTFYGFGKRPIFTLGWSVLVVSLFGVIWMARKPENEADEYIIAKKRPGNVLDALFFSATVFLSGMKFFVDPPFVPELQGISKFWVRKVFIAERVLGAFFSALFILALTGMVLRPI